MKFSFFAPSIDCACSIDPAFRTAVLSASDLRQDLLSATPAIFRNYPVLSAILSGCILSPFDDLVGQLLRRLAWPDSLGS